MAELHGESPLAARTETLADSSVPGALQLSEVAFTAQVALRVDPKSPAAERIGTAVGTMLPNQPGQVARTEQLQILWMGPDEWLLVGPEGSAERIQATLTEALGEEHGSVVDVSGNRTIVEVTGPKSRELLAKGCALDLHRRSFASDQCAQTLLARAGVVLLCRDTERPSFWIFVRASFARYLADWLADAAAEYRV
ncbi:MULTISPECIES: sarcosine oxidase subunit gamma [Prauserella salsuginis group]|uniref:Sarcosine oxidase subunit gamma n=1 Tax=Prauserella salsuginis TaxID=387889 RepID=A0ABW6FVY8_9PSEU|nr:MULTISPECIES: sarcosine oxidase subunit gamma family protein [Prauserella salsuginis group]MCR3720153.1 sarcosine oxidase subunit gamma [Prauserella flava]MCR3734138.1 sarcosine oxidase subunit gamma [Prauserella salsuginis]